MSQARSTLPETPVDLDPIKIASQLRENYKRGNIQRLDSISLYEKVKSDMILIFEFEFIEQRYKYLSPERSQMYAELHKILGEVSLDDRLIKLTQLRRYAREKLTDEIVKCSTWPTKQALQKEIDSTIRYLVKIKEKARINQLLHLKPDLAALKNNIKEHYLSYKSSLIGRFFQPNPEREAALTFVNFFSVTCDKLYGTDYLDKTREENQQNPDYVKNYQRHVGIFLFALLQINNSYTMRSPGWSSWFREGLVAIGYTSLDDIPTNEKILWLTKARKHLEKVKRVYSAKPGKTTDKDAYQELIDEWKAKRKMPSLDDLHYKLGEMIQQLEKDKYEHKPASIVARTAQSVTLSAAATILQTTVLRGFTAFGLIPAITTAIGGIFGGPIGFTVGACLSPIIGTFINYLIVHQIIPWAVGSLSTTLIERIGKKRGDEARATAFSIFTSDGLPGLKDHYDKVIGDKFSDELVMALLELPDDMVAKADKRTIRKIWGIPDPDLPKDAKIAPFVVVEDYEAPKAGM